MSAGYETVTTTHAVCQHCGERLGAVDHLGHGRAWGPWYCDTCGGASRGVVGGAVERVEDQRKVSTLALLRLDTATGPFWFIVEGMRFTHSRPLVSEQEDDRFFYEEHSCPTNWLKPLMVAHRGDTDPHGVIQFVRAVDKPASLPNDSNDEDLMLEQLFPEVRR